MRATLHLWNAQQGHTAWSAAWRDTLKPMLHAGHQFEATIRPARRSTEQNSAQWPILQAFSQQLKWPVNGEMVEMDPDEWKDVLTAAFKRERIRVAMGLDGGVVMLGLRTRKFSKEEFSEWLDFLKATAALRGVETNETETA